MSAPLSPARAGSSLTAIAASALLVATLGAGAWWACESLVVTHSVSESRTVADMAENVGRWASQYGGIHARTIGTEAKIPGSFLTRSVYAVSGDDSAVLSGTRVGQGEHEQERGALQRVEAYHWKNPALVQREVADVIAASGSKARYRMTARTVLNSNNAPNAFESQAMDALQAGDSARQEYWTTRDGQLLYARAVIAQKSCLNCHASADKAPDFLRTNAQFNGGGGFGYVEGKPVGVISVSLPLPSTWQALSDSLPTRAWAALATAALAAVVLVVALVRRNRVG
jgi:Protein of unknown function (DUF3365)